MTTRVNGGYLNGQFLTGSLRHFALTGVDFSQAIAGSGGVTEAGREYEEGQPIPGSAAEQVYRVLAQRSTPVIMYIDGDGALHVAMENTSTAWLDETDPAVGANADGVPANAGAGDTATENLLAVLSALGDEVGFDDVDLTDGAFTITEVPYVLDIGNDVISTATN